MLNNNYVLGWEEVDHDLYEEDGHVFGIGLDLFNNHQTFYHKYGGYYYDLSSDIYEAIKQFNEVLESSRNDKRRKD